MNIKLIICMVVFLFSGTCMAQPGEFFAGQFNLNIDGRTDTPYPALPNYNTALTQSGSGPDYTVQMSRHHIIPMNRLIAFYNLVSQNNRLRNLSGFLNTYANNVRFYANSNGVNCQSLQNDLLNTGNLAQAQALGLARTGGQVRPESFDSFQDFYTWLPGNIFIGPRTRSDDPSEGFESNAYVVVGAETFDTLSRINRDMENYINSNGDDNSLLNAINVNLNRIAARRSMYQLNSKDWVLVDGKYKLSTGSRTISIEPAEVAQTSDIDTCSDMAPTELAVAITAIL